MFNNCLSESRRVGYGVAHEFVLGPKLTFTCYLLVVLLESITFIFNCYADDTELYLSIKPKESGLLKDQFVKLHTWQNDIESWMTQNFLMVQMVSLLCIILL